MSPNSKVYNKVALMLPFCDFKVPVMLPFSKILVHLPLIEISDTYRSDQCSTSDLPTGDPMALNILCVPYGTQWDLSNSETPDQTLAPPVLILFDILFFPYYLNNFVLHKFWRPRRQNLGFFRPKIGIFLKKSPPL